jgi:DNA-binding transcriptional ArsR family regulator
MTIERLSELYLKCCYSKFDFYIGLVNLLASSNDASHVLERVPAELRNEVTEMARDHDASAGAAGCTDEQKIPRTILRRFTPQPGSARERASAETKKRFPVPSHGDDTPTSAWKTSPPVKGARLVESRWAPVRQASIQFRNLSDPTRVSIVMLLAEGEQTVSSLCGRLDQTRPHLSHHLSLLRSGRVIARRREGNTIVYALTDLGEKMADVIQELARLTDPVAPVSGPAR